MKIPILEATDKRARLTALAAKVPMVREWQAAVEALDAGNVQPLLKLPVWERAFLESEIPGVLEKLEELAPRQ